MKLKQILNYQFTERYLVITWIVDDTANAFTLTKENSYIGITWPTLKVHLTLDLMPVDWFVSRVFSQGGGPPSGKNFANPPIRHLSPFLDQGLSPQPRFVPENLKNLNTFLCQIWLLLSSKIP